MTPGELPSAPIAEEDRRVLDDWLDSGRLRMEKYGFLVATAIVHAPPVPVFKALVMTDSLQQRVSQMAKLGLQMRNEGRTVSRLVILMEAVVRHIPREENQPAAPNILDDPAAGTSVLAAWQDADGHCAMGFLPFERIPLLEGQRFEWGTEREYVHWDIAKVAGGMPMLRAFWDWYTRPKLVRLDGLLPGEPAGH